MTPDGPVLLGDVGADVFSAADGGGRHYIIAASGAAYRLTAARNDGFLFMATDLQDIPNQLRHALTAPSPPGSREIHDRAKHKYSQLLATREQISSRP